MTRIGVMQITDSLALGGLERVAVNVANELPADSWRSFFCTTRQRGPLECTLSAHVNCLHLDRCGRFDFAAICKLSGFIREHGIQLLHAHGTSLFVAAAASMFNRTLRVIWHDHFGRFETEKRPPAYRLAARTLHGVISVTEPLAQWAQNCLKIKNVCYIPNFVSTPNYDRVTALLLPGMRGQRVVSVANLRPQKDHITLLHAFALVTREFPYAHLLLVGAASDAEYRSDVEQTIARLKLLNNVSWLGSHSNVPAVLANCDVGVLSSVSEGLPLALLEYGMAGLPAVATNVGQCAEVLGHGYAGLLVPPSSAERLATAMAILLRSSAARRTLSKKFKMFVTEKYSSKAVIDQVCGVYRSVINPSHAG